MDEDDDEDGDEEEEDEQGEDENEGVEGSIVEEDPLSDEEEKPKKQDKGKGRRKKTLEQEFFQGQNSQEDEPNPRRESKRRRKASQEDDATLTNREVVPVNNGLEQYGVSIDSVGTHVKLCLRSNIHAKKQLAAALRLALEVPNNLPRWHFFPRSEYIPSPTNLVSTLRREAYKYKDYPSLYFFCASCIKRDELIEPTGPNRSFHFV